MKRLLTLLPLIMAAPIARADQDESPDRARMTAAFESPVLADPSIPRNTIGSPTSAVGDASFQGNPLWAVPLDALSATRGRPLFSVSRRPPPPAVVTPPAPKTPAGPIEAKPAEPERPPFALVGTIVGGNANFALLLNRSTNLVTRIREGETDMGWQARKVGVGSILLQRGSESATLELPKPNDPPNSGSVLDPEARRKRPAH